MLLYYVLNSEEKTPLNHIGYIDESLKSDDKPINKIYTGLSIQRRIFDMAFSIHEQRLVGVILALLFLASGCVWTINYELSKKQTFVLRAPLSLKQEAQKLTGSVSISYDQLAFFIIAVLPRLYSVDENGYPFLPLIQGLIDPSIISHAEAGFNQLGSELKSNHMTQTLTVTAINDVIADEKLGRAAAYVKGNVCVTLNQARVLFYPYRAQVLLAVNPVGLLNPYPFYILKCEEKIGAKAIEWDLQHDNKRFLDL